MGKFIVLNAYIRSQINDLSFHLKKLGGKKAKKPKVRRRPVFLMNTGAKIVNKVLKNIEYKD